MVSSDRAQFKSGLGYKQFSNMKFIKQLSEDEFVVKMEPYDKDSSKRIVLAHDYLLISGRDWNCTNLRIKGPYGWGNVVQYNARVQIPIRMAQDMLKRVLTPDRKYLKGEHLTYSNGTPAYSDEAGTKYYYAKDDGTKMVAIYDKEKNEYIHLPQSVFGAIKEAVKED